MATRLFDGSDPDVVDRRGRRALAVVAIVLAFGLVGCGSSKASGGPGSTSSTSAGTATTGTGGSTAPPGSTTTSPGSGSTSATTPGSSGTTAATSTVTTIAPASELTITLADNGRSLNLRKDGQGKLVLGNGRAWTEPVVDGAAIRLHVIEFLVPTGDQQWAIQILTAGTVAIRSYGTPICDPGKICSKAVLVFSVRLTIV